MKKTIIDLVKTTSWRDIQKALKYHYPKDKNNYEPVFNYLFKTKKGKIKEKEELQIRCLKKDELNDDDYYSTNGTKYSLSLRKWREVASLPIEEETYRNNKDAEIVAHFIWEITFYGNEKDIEKLKKELNLAAKEIKKHIK